MNGGTMQSRRLGVCLFSVGVFFLFVNTTAPFLWHLIGVPWAYPFAPTGGSVMLISLPGFTPAVGAALMVTGGLVYGRKREG